MNQLAKLQQTFQDCVLHPDDSVTTDWICASGRAAPETQLSVYTHAYEARLQEVLANDYPAMLMAIGEESFNRLCADYINAYPSLYFSLRDFGRHLPKFIAEPMQLNEHSQDRHWLHELAMFEWTLGQAFDAADVTLMTEQDVAAIPPELWPELRFRLAPAVHRLDLEWNIPEMWLILTNDNPTQITAVHAESSSWLVWREELVTRFRSMQHDEQLALDEIRQGGNFNDVCEVLATVMRENEVPMHAASLLKSWLSQGLIGGLTDKDEIN
jgi:hypothetical protein